MSRAEEEALKLYPDKKVVLARGNTCLSCGRVRREAYINGYQQAEKDLALTWEDIRKICVQSVLVEVDLGGLVSDERHYTEVLKRFKTQKGEEV